MVPLIVVLLWLLPLSAQATTYYVATTGNNANDGSEATPFLTIDKCSRLLVAGDTCLVRGGTYTESGGVRILASGTATNPIRLAAYPGENPIISFPAQTSSNRILITHTSGDNVAMGYITVEGFEITGGWDGIKFTSMHNSIIRNNKIHDGFASGILGIGGHHNLFEKNIIYHQGDFATCTAGGTAACTQQHGMYLHGDSYTIRNNVFYDNIGSGIQQNGSSSSTYSASRHPSAEFAGASNWIIESNTFAYQANGAGLIVWSTLASNSRVENNIFYENRVAGTSSQAIFFTGNSMSGVSIKNNHAYASGSGGTAFIGALSSSPVTEGVQYTQSGNVTNVSPPAFVNGGSNSLPASPDFRLTASAPVNICLTNEFPNNSTCVVGAFKTVANPIASITTHKITLTFPMSTAVPITNLSTAGVTAACTGTNCPGALTVTAVSSVPNTDTKVEIPVSGFAGNACLSTNLTVTTSYDASTGTLTGGDNIGPYPGLNQKVFSYTNLAVTNNCTGSGPSGYPAGYHLWLKFDDGSGTNANDESANNLDCTLTNTPTWTTGKSGGAMAVASGTQQYCALAWGSGVNPSTQDLTIFVPIYIETGTESALHYVGGPDLGTNQRAYICGQNGTWKVSIQSTSCQSTAASNLAVTAGWNVLTLRFDSTADVATLYKDAVAGTGGASVAYTSFTFATNLKIGKLHTNAATGNYRFDDFIVYLSLQDPATLSAAFNAEATPQAGTLAQAAIQAQGVVLDPAGNPIIIGPLVQSFEVPAGGGIVLLFQVHCQNIADCAITAFKLVYAKNGSGIWQQVPNTETADGTWMWGSTPVAHMNNGTRSTRLTGSCAVTTGTTQVTAEQIPSVDLPQDGCVVLAYIPRIGSSQAGNYFDYKLRTESDLDLDVYTQIARIRVVNPMASGIGF